MVKRESVLVLAVGAVALVVFFGWLVSRRQASRAPSPDAPESVAAGTSPSGKTIQVTRGVKHLVPLDEIVGGGPPKDGIPSIDAPKFTTLPERDSVLRDEGIGLAFVVGEDARFYPYQILVWHEIVNDTVGGTPVGITYCPLCLTGIVFDRRVEGQETTFGTSGKLWQSNLVMYDRATDSYWSQVTGEAIVGERSGTALTILPADTMPLRVFAARYPVGKVLTTETGHRRDYTLDPYGDYYTSKEVGFGVRQQDARFHPKEVVMGVVLDGTAVAIPVKLVLDAGQITGTVGNTTIVAKGDREAQSVQVFRRLADGSLERLPAFPVFWFSWYASHPQTLVTPTQ